jgi:predicted component of type VI protein secretion system
MAPCENITRIARSNTKFIMRLWSSMGSLGLANPLPYYVDESNGRRKENTSVMKMFFSLSHNINFTSPKSC